MKYKIEIKASFNYVVEIEADSENSAKAMASDSLMDYLDIKLRDKTEFDYFHEYKLVEEFIYITELND